MTLDAGATLLSHRKDVSLATIQETTCTIHLPRLTEEVVGALGGERVSSLRMIVVVEALVTETRGTAMIVAIPRRSVIASVVKISETRGAASIAQAIPRINLVVVALEVRTG